MCCESAASAHTFAAAADTAVVRTRVRVIRELVDRSMYLVDEQAVADAIVLRARTRSAVPGRLFRSRGGSSLIRSFKRAPYARSFRLSRGLLPRRTPH